MPPTPSSFQQPALVVQSQQTQLLPSQYPSPHNQQFQTQPPHHQPPLIPSKFTAQGQWPNPHLSSPHHQPPLIPSKFTAQGQWPNPHLSPPLTPPSQAEMDNKPWKYLGYPGFSTWSASSKDAFVLRRFNATHARVILYMQDQRVKKEDELAYLDRCCVTCPGDIDNGTFRYDFEPQRNILLDDLRVRLKEYGKPNDVLMGGSHGSSPLGSNALRNGTRRRYQ